MIERVTRDVLSEMESRCLVCHCSDCNGEQCLPMYTDALGRNMRGCYACGGKHPLRECPEAHAIRGTFQEAQNESRSLVCWNCYRMHDSSCLRVRGGQCPLQRRLRRAMQHYFAGVVANDPSAQYQAFLRSNFLCAPMCSGRPVELVLPYKSVLSILSISCRRYSKSSRVFLSISI